QTAVLAALGVDPEAPARSDAMAFAAAMIVASTAGALTLLLVLRREPLLAVLAVQPTPPGTTAAWVLAAAACAELLDRATLATGGDVVPLEWRTAYAAAGSPGLLIAALVVSAPLFEEAYFRGFLHGGLAATRLGERGAAAVVALLFTAAHGPADVHAVVQGLTYSALLGAARLHSGSIVPSILVHMLLNGRVLVILAEG
ncbi:MAG TPA: CPBP family intramembrane metalloprotease, partial [Myxococcota bacterium]|nr:CPBP family intramembrane metalloprotease [Myxococcota bacterium]